MSKFSNVQFDENGNVKNLSFPKSNLSVGIEYIDPTENEYMSTPSNVLIDGHKISTEQFKEVEVDKGGNISVGGSSGSGKPWWMWWDWIGGLIPHETEIKDNINTTVEIGDNNDGNS